jgi:hypothetical protein
MNDLSTPVPMEEIKGIVTVNLDKAAKLNFAQVQQESRLEGKSVISATYAELSKVSRVSKMRSLCKISFLHPVCLKFSCKLKIFSSKKDVLLAPVS